MRRSKADAAQTRRRVVEEAARAFRARGVQGVSVPDLMQRAGLTHGGFYKHFASKDALVAEACALALNQTHARLRAAARAAPAGEGARAIIEAYLSVVHRDHPEEGCAIAALGSEIARDDPATRRQLTLGVQRLVALLGEHLSGPLQQREELAHSLVAGMIGALLVARTVDDAGLSTAVIDNARSQLLLQLVQTQGGGHG